MGTSDKSIKIVKILENLYIDDGLCGNSAKCLNENGITHLININSQPFPSYRQKFPIEYLEILVPVELDRSMKPIFKLANEFIEETGKKQGCKILVHSQDGISNSAVIVTAYLMKSKKLTFAEYLQFLNKQTPLPEFSTSCKNELIAYEKDLIAQLETK